MSAAPPTKVARMKLGAEPKKVAILGILLAVAIGMFIYNAESGGGETNPVLQNHAPATVTPSAITSPRRTRLARRTNATRDRGVLRIQTVDPRNGDIDPTLRLDLLARLQSVQPMEGGRSLFELGPDPNAAAAKPLPPVKIVPQALSPTGGIHPAGPTEAAFTIPLKFYGFEKPKSSAPTGNRGFFLDGDNILVASEGELLKNRFLVVELTPTSAKLEDTQLKKGQTLPLVPEARNEY